VRPRVCNVAAASARFSCPELGPRTCAHSEEEQQMFLDSLPVYSYRAAPCSPNAPVLCMGIPTDFGRKRANKEGEAPNPPLVLGRSMSRASVAKRWLIPPLTLRRQVTHNGICTRSENRTVLPGLPTLAGDQAQARARASSPASERSRPFRSDCGLRPAGSRRAGYIELGATSSCSSPHYIRHSCLSFGTRRSSSQAERAGSDQ
jgi:hypothetical protein